MNYHSHKEGKPFLVVVTGPTGIGKTQLSIELASSFNSQIISADSRQMFRELKIGTAVPSPEQLKKVRHYFIGNLSINDYYNASMFEVESITLLEELFRTKKVVFMTGGSGLYVDAVCYGIDDLPSADQEIRSDLAEKYRLFGLPWLQKQLLQLDPEHFNIVDLNNPKRILKALEISLMTGKTYTSFLKRTRKERSFNTIKIGLNRDRKELYEIINKRVDEMISNGLVEEARDLFRYKNLNALNTVGYKEIFDYFEGEIILEKAIELIKRNSRRYAKRQLTWLAKDKDMIWFHPEEYNRMHKHIKMSVG